MSQASGKKRKASVPAQPSVALEEAERSIIAVCQASDRMVDQDSLQAETMLAPELMLAACNRLLNKGRLVSFMRGSSVCFALQSRAEAKKLFGLSTEERLIYQEVEKSANEGATVKTLRAVSNLSQVQVANILKTLEDRLLVQSVKSVVAAKKVYMVHGLTPSAKLTGGSWYSGAEFDHELIRALQQVATGYLENKGQAGAATILSFITQTGIVRGKQPSLRDMEQVLQALVYDARIEMLHNARVEEHHTGETIYQAVPPLPSIEKYAINFTSIPPFVDCQQCPACAQRRDDVPCEMMDAWLSRAVTSHDARPDERQGSRPYSRTHDAA